MLFHTWLFFIFFAVVYPVYLLVRSTRWRFPLLFTASYFFYGCWNPLYLLLIAYSTAVDYAAVRLMARYGRKKRFVALSVVNNLGLLCYFKYAEFLADNLNALARAVGLGLSIPAPDVLLPVGISFFVFQSMSYSIDFYRGEVDCEPNFIRYATFVSFFPQLVAGPIERASHLLPQLQKRPRIALSDVCDGASLFLVGLFKKVAMADYLALYVDKVYSSPAGFSSSDLLLATVAFGWQIYFDFAGYTDMARGLGRMMGIRIMLNFDNPYLATGLGDFWKRWHISLSTWFKDYVYIPLGGNRKGIWNTYKNMTLTMVISGIWHGAAWTFIIWGALHALGRILTRELERSRIYRERVPKLAKQMIVFLFVTFTWIFFRARTLGHAWAVVKGIFSWNWATPSCPLLAMLMIAAVWAYEFIYESRFRPALQTGLVRVALASAMLVAVMLFGGSEQPFIYFQF